LWRGQRFDVDSTSWRIDPNNIRPEAREGSPHLKVEAANRIRLGVHTKDRLHLFDRKTGNAIL